LISFWGGGERFGSLFFFFVSIQTGEEVWLFFYNSTPHGEKLSSLMSPSHLCPFAPCPFSFPRYRSRFFSMVFFARTRTLFFSGCFPPSTPCSFGGEPPLLPLIPPLALTTTGVFQHLPFFLESFFFLASTSPWVFFNRNGFSFPWVFMVSLSSLLVPTIVFPCPVSLEKA